MKKGLPSILQLYPGKVFAKVEKPVLLIMLIIGFAVKARSFGTKGFGTFDLAYGLGGLLIFEVVLFITFFAMGGRTINQLVRFQVLYMAFVQGLNFVYLKRMLDIKTMFTIREDVVAGKYLAAIGLWYPKPASLLKLLIPFILLLIMAWAITEKDNGLTRVLDAKGKPIHGIKTFTDGKLPVWYQVVGIVGLILILLTLPFANFTNFMMYAASLICVCLIWDMWERIRKHVSVEPTLMVAWTEILLFLALWLKGIVDNL